MDGTMTKRYAQNIYHIVIRSTYVGLAWLMALPSIAGTIAFDAKATLDANRDQIHGTLTLTLNANESIYDATLIATGSSERARVDSIPLWEQHTAKTFNIVVPSTHHQPGKYHLLVEIAFHDQGGGRLNAAMALDYDVQDAAVTGKPSVTIQGENLVWNLGTQPPENVTVLAATPYFGEWTGLPWRLDTARLPLTIRRDAKLQPNWIYPQTARLDWIENDIHGSSTITWPFVTDERGHWRRQIDSSKPPAAQSKSFTVSAQSTLTATPARLIGDVTLTFSDSDTIHDVEVRAIAQGAETLVSARPIWKPGEPLPIRFDVGSSHSLPGNYHALLPIRFRDAQQNYYDAIVSLNYRVNRASTDTTPPNVVIGNKELTWQIGSLSPSDVSLTMTSSPNWNSQPLHIPASTRDFQLVLENGKSILPNWTYPQLARLDWVTDGIHFSRLINWFVQTNDRGDWSMRADSPEVVSGDLSTTHRPWWRRIALLWVVTGLIIGLALVQGVRQMCARRVAAAAPNHDNQPAIPSPDKPPYE
jgi:hypothetical protein